MSIQKAFPYLKIKTRRSFFIFLALLGMMVVGTVFAFATETNFTNQSPSNGSTVTTTNPKISVYVKSTSSLNTNSLIMNLNGTSVPANLQLKGHWEEDYYEGTIWVIEDDREGTISFDATGLKDGLNTVDITIKDTAGNVLKDNWTFTVAAPPLFKNLSPAENSVNTSVNSISAKVSDDNSDVDWNTVKLKINNTYIDPAKLSVNKETGVVTYNSEFPNGGYNVTFEAKDPNGNLGAKSWAFYVDSNPPEITNLQYFQDKQIISDGKFKFRAELSDANEIKENAVLTLNGNPLKSNFQYEGFTDYYGDYIVTSKKTATISYEENLPNGNYTLSLYSEDSLGNKITRNWSFIVSTKPEISNVTPVKYGITDLKPLISATVKGAYEDSIILKVNGNTVKPTFNTQTGLVTYLPDEPLKNENYQTVNLTVLYGSGLSVNREWKFYTNTYPDMSDSNINNCLTCHQAKPVVGSNGKFEEVHAGKLSFSGTHAYNNCESCHKYITYQAGCSQCHWISDEQPYAPHGSTPTIKYQAKSYNESFPLRVTENREMWDCIVCHQPGSNAASNSHDIPELHKSTSDSGCTACHAQSLTREHAREGRVDNSNNPITCNTCHQSSNSTVTKAITEKNKTCSACHSDLDHTELHTTQLEENCSGCHKKALSTEHINRGQTCDTCHKSTDPKVVTAVTNKNKTCSACHENPGHKGNHDVCATCHKEGSSYNR